jgi:hypothetical protein
VLEMLAVSSTLKQGEHTNLIVMQAQPGTWLNSKGVSVNGKYQRMGTYSVATDLS